MADLESIKSSPRHHPPMKFGSAKRALGMHSHAADRAEPEAIACVSLKAWLTRKTIRSWAVTGVCGVGCCGIGARVLAGLGGPSITPMANVPAACQALADQVSTLDQQYGALAAQVSQEEGAQAWQDLARLGGLRQQLEAAQAALSACVQANSAALTGIVDVIDATGAAAQGTQTVTLWDVSGASAVPAGQAPVTSGAFGLKGPVPAKSALTLQTTGAAGFGLSGYDLRSGVLPDPLPALPLRCEMVICPRCSCRPRRSRPGRRRSRR